MLPSRYLGALAPSALVTHFDRAVLQLDRAIAGLRAPRHVELDPDTASTLSWRDVEHLVGDAFRRRGYGVEPASRGQTPFDLVLHKDGEKILVNCKHWKVWEVGDHPLHELYGYMGNADSLRAVMVTTGRFTQKAKDFADRHNFRLIDGSGLAELVQGT